MVKSRLNRRIYIPALFIMSLFLITGCGKKDSKSSSSVAEEAKSSAGISVEIPPMSTSGVLYGIVLEANEKSLTVQSDTGNTIRLKLDEKADVSEVKDGIVSGGALRIEYEGSIKGNSAKEVKVSKIVESDKAPKLSREALAKAGEIILAVRNRDISTLARLCEYPLTFDGDGGKRINGVQAFISLNRNKVFTKRLVNSVSSTNLFIMTAYKDGFLLGVSEPNILVQNTKKGYQITGFRY